MTRAAPEFWWQPGIPAQALALWPAAKLWGAAAAWRMSRPPRFRPAAATVCVGNFVVGGAGKTPTAVALTRVARSRGLKPGILASGYGGSLRGPVLVDPTVHRAEDVGDEALVLAAAAPTVVAADRVAGARALVRDGVDLIVMDDGFQDPALHKDLTLVVVDALSGVGNGFTIPSGPLRAPLSRQLLHTDALLVIGEGVAGEHLIRAAARAGRAVQRARLKPAKVRAWRKEPILAFAGIGRPEKFFATLAEIGATVAKTHAFPDHHPFTDAEAAELIAAADSEGLRLVTTEKDAARLAGKDGVLGALRERTDVFAVSLEFDNPAAIDEMIDTAVRKAALAAA